MKTKLLFPAATENQTDIAFGHLWLTAGSGYAVWGSTNAEMTGKSFTGSGMQSMNKGQVSGAEVILFNTYAPGSSTTSLNVSLSIDGGSTFSTTHSTGNLSLTSQNLDYNFGGTGDLWGLDWSSFSDISNLRVKAENNTDNWAASDAVAIQIYHYSNDVKISSNVSIKGGNLTIK